MKKVVSFKVDADVYRALKKIMRSENVSFSSLFGPLAIQLAQNNRKGLKYTGVYRQNSSDLYQDLVSIQKTIQKVIKSCDFDKKKAQ